MYGTFWHLLILRKKIITVKKNPEQVVNGYAKTSLYYSILCPNVHARQIPMCLAVLTARLLGMTVE